MPTKLLVWNIQRFTARKIDLFGEAVGRTSWGVGKKRTYTNPDAGTRLDYILNNVTVSSPQIFVVIELISSEGVKGSLVQGLGAQGILLLLRELRAINPNWMLVPPLKLVDRLQIQELEDDDDKVFLEKEGAYTEAVGVFYRNDALQFLGPWAWPASNNNNDPQKIAVATASSPQAYPAPWNSTLPPEDSTKAGQYSYTNPRTNKEIRFPAIGSRRPFFTKFQERAGGRIISLASVHFPPNSRSAGSALGAITQYFTQFYQIAQNEVIAIAGDYNLDYLSPKVTDRTYLLTLQLLGFEPIFDAETELPTMYKRPKIATPKSYLNMQGLDNCAFKYGSGLVRPNPIDWDILERVSDVDPPVMMTAIDQILTQPEEQGIKTFRLVENFGGIGASTGTSDHIAISVVL